MTGLKEFRKYSKMLMDLSEKETISTDDYRIINIQLTNRYAFVICSKDDENYAV